MRSSVTSFSRRGREAGGCANSQGLSPRDPSIRLRRPSPARRRRRGGLSSHESHRTGTRATGFASTSPDIAGSSTGTAAGAVEGRPWRSASRPVSMEWAHVTPIKASAAYPPYHQYAQQPPQPLQLNSSQHRSAPPVATAVARVGLGCTAADNHPATHPRRRVAEPSWRRV